MTDSEWKKILEEVSKKIPPIYYGSFISNLSLLSYDDSKITLSAPSETIKNHISQKYQHYIEEAAFKIAGKQLSIEILTDVSPTSIRPISNFLDEKYQTEKYDFNLDFKFDTFIVSESNTFAFKAARQIKENLGFYNPIYLFGGIGVGKTHLLHAIGISLIAENIKTKYITASSFLNEFIYSLQSKTGVENFRTRYQSYSCLLFDDIQYITSTAEKTQEELYHLLNYYFERKKQIVITSDRPISELPIQERIRSRLMLGQQIEILKPDIEIREALVRRKMEEFHLQLGTESIQFLVEHFQSDIRNLLGSLSELAFYKKIYGLLFLPHDKVLEILENRLERQKDFKNIQQEIIDSVCEHFSQEKKDVFSKSRKAELILPRHTIMFLLHEVCKLSKSQIGKMFFTNHSAVIAAIKKVIERQKNDPNYAKLISEIRRRHELY